jgi:hypothetical protein
MWRNTVQPDRQQTTTRRMRIACWIPKAINTHSEYVTHIAFRCNNGCTDSPQCCVIQGGSNMTGTDLCVKKAAQVPVIFEPPCTYTGCFVNPHKIKKISVRSQRGLPM